MTVRPNVIDVKSYWGVIEMKCFVCGNKIGLLEDKGFTQDHKFICYEDINKLFGTDKARKHAVPAELKNELNQITSAAMLKAFSNGLNGKPFCPYCGSENVQPLGQHRKMFSVGKAAVGAAITGGVGLAAGRRSLNSLANQLESHRLIDSYEHNQLKASIDYRNSIAHATPITQIRNIIQHIFEGIHLIVQKIIDSRND